MPLFSPSSTYQRLQATQESSWLSARHAGPRKLRQAQPCAAAAAPGVAAPPAETRAAFDELVQEQATSCAVSLGRSCAHGLGLFLERDAAPGDVVLSVPQHACLVVDYQSGLQLPQAEWPRLRRGLQKDDSTPWDLLQALALLDALSGTGGAFWERYTNSLLPQPLELALPFCLPDLGLLQELQHEAIIEGARQQKQRLQGLFPGLSQPMCNGGPTWIEWAFACVRSRAFRLRDDAFAFVPFLDIANHAPEPSCDFRVSADGAAVELVAVKAVGAGEEATISYTGPQGLTNQRLMVQYGFVPPGGNTADRLTFDALTSSSSSRRGSAAAGTEARAAGAAGAGAQQRVLLSLDRLQTCLGDGQTMAAAFTGRDPYFYAALKSLPLALSEDEEAAAAVSWAGQLQLAGVLLAELEGERLAWATSGLEDQQWLQAWQGKEGEGSTSSSSSGGAVGGDARLAAAVQYRLQRKKLVSAATLLLRRFVESA